VIKIVKFSSIFYKRSFLTNCIVLKINFIDLDLSIYSFYKTLIKRLNKSFFYLNSAKIYDFSL